jgi:hypothetical protein
MLSKRYEELWANISEIKVEKWIEIVAAERVLPSTSFYEDLLTFTSPIQKNKRYF